jgi:hypothetical protein
MTFTLFGTQKQEGAGGQNSPAPMLGVGRTSFVSSIVNHVSGFLAKTDRKQTGDIWEKAQGLGMADISRFFHQWRLFRVEPCFWCVVGF